ARPSRRGTGSGGPRNLRRPHRVRYAASTRPVRRLSAAGLGRSAAAGLPQRVDELLLAHGGAAGDVQLPGAFVEVLFAGVGVHSAGRPGGALPCAALGLRVGRPLASLRLPVVTDLLVAVLEGGERRPVCAAALDLGRDRG